MGIKAWIQSHKSQIIVGIVVSIVTAIIIKFGELILLLAPKAGNSVWGALRDSIFYNAGRFSVTTPIIILVSGLATVGVASTISLSLSTLRTVKHRKFKDEVNQMISKKEADPSFSLSNDDIKMIEQYTEKLKKESSTKTIKKSMVVSILLWLFLVTYIWCTIVLPSGLNHEFERCVTLIAPYVEERDILMLRSQWVSMEGKKDYDEINKTIWEIREQHNLT